MLFLHLKRFEFDFEAMKKLKLDDNFEFPQTINMRPYTVDALSPATATTPTRSDTSADVRPKADK